MNKISIGNNLVVPSVSLGCMSITSLDDVGRKNIINTALENDINFFEHANIYGGGLCEFLFAETIANMGINREDIILQSKCGIRKGVGYDSSKEHILTSVDESLKRLNTEYLDSLLIHRPDALVEPEEVAEAFDILNTSGKVRNFGVSNHNPYQIELLKKYCNVDLSINQLQLSITESGMIDAGINVNMKVNEGIDRDGGILDYCRLNDITIQAWSPFRYGFFEGIFIDSDKYPELNNKLQEVADRYGVTKISIAVSWILRHPAKIQVVVGTMKPQRLKDIVKGSDITLTKQEWYDIYRASGKKLP